MHFLLIYGVVPKPLTKRLTAGWIVPGIAPALQQARNPTSPLLRMSFEGVVAQRHMGVSNLLVCQEGDAEIDGGTAVYQWRLRKVPRHPLHDQKPLQEEHNENSHMGSSRNSVTTGYTKSKTLVPTLKARKNRCTYPL